MIEIKNVSKTYNGKKKVLNNVSFKDISYLPLFSIYLPQHTLGTVCELLSSGIGCVILIKSVHGKQVI